MVYFFKIKMTRALLVLASLRRYSLTSYRNCLMSFSGNELVPRPLPVRDVENFSAHHFIRHEVLPGITGLWQVSGRTSLTLKK